MISRARNVMASLRDGMSSPHRLRALSLIRIIFGINVLALYAQHLRQYEFLWGDQGLMPWSTFMATLMIQRNYSLYALTSDGHVAALLFGAGAVVAFLFTIGAFTRVVSVLFFIFTWSLYTRNIYLLDGGDNLLYLTALLMIFTNCAAYYSVDAIFRTRRAANRFVAMLHNYAVIAIMAQTCMVYLISAFYKVGGHKWQDGTALYYILHVDEFQLVPWVVHAVENPMITTVMTYGTMLTQAAFPFLIFHKRLKWFVVPAIVGMHVGIGYTMGLAYFSSILIAVEAIFFTDRDIVKVTSVVQGFVKRCARLRIPKFPLSSAAPPILQPVPVKER